MTEIEKLHGLHNTGLTMDQRFTLLAQQSIGRRGKRHPFPVRTRSQRQNPALIEALSLYNQLENHVQRFQPVQGMAAYGRGRGRGGLRRFGSEGSIRSVGLGRKRSNSFGDINQNKYQKWRWSNSNLSLNGSVHSSRAGSVQSHGYWLRGDVAPRRVTRGRGRGRGRGFRGRVHQGRVNRLNDSVGGRARPARGVGRRGVRRNLVGPRGTGRGAQWGAGRGPQQGTGRGVQRGAGRGRGGISRAQTPKPVPTKEELDAQLEEYMSGTKAALDKELDEYMRNAMDFD